VTIRVAPHVIALDVDGTLFDGVSVDARAIETLTLARRAGHAIVIVTGRRWRDLPEIIPDVLPLTDAAICEEGAVLVDVVTGEHRLFAEPPPAAMMEALWRAGVDDPACGEVTIGMSAAHEAAARAIAERFGGFRITRNKTSVAIVPDGCDKRVAVERVVAHLGLGSRPLIAIGDAGNDLPMFEVATIAVAVANADESVREAGIELTEARFGAGVAEAIERHLLGGKPTGERAVTGG
jgi:hydroxymethylpyrimidine pyrophosphatase-like HAD family hydrolase